MLKVAKRVMSGVLALVMIVAAFAIVELPAKAENAADYSAVFDAAYYAAVNPDVAAAYGSDATALFDHFINHGMVEGRQGNAEFNVHVYKERYADLCAAFGDNLKAYYMHYINCGKAEGRSGVAEAEKPATTPVEAEAPTFNKSEETVVSIIEGAKSVYPEGCFYPSSKRYAWHGGIVYDAGGAEGFAFNISDRVFDNLHAWNHSDFSMIRTGDILYMENGRIAVVQKAYDQFVYLCGVEGPSVYWDRYMSRAELNRQLIYVCTRYPR